MASPLHHLLLLQIVITFAMLCTNCQDLKQSKDTIRCFEREREALLVFKDGIEDDEQLLSSWGRNEDQKECCKWTGIICSNRTGHITTLDLSSLSTFNHTLNHTLKASNISSSLVYLRHHLTKLDLSYVNFRRSPLPTFIGAFKKLKLLALVSTSLSGTFPSEIRKLSKLEVLDVAFNFFEGTILSEAHFQNLSKLKSLRLSNSSLSLNFSSSWLPPFELMFLGLSSCRLGPHFPQWLQSQKKSLEYIDLSSNGISDPIPTWLWDMCARLSHFDLSSNNIGGMLPDLSSKFGGPVMINLSFNDFEGTLPMLPSNVTTLNLSHNKFSGTLFNSLCSVKKIYITLDLSHNHFTGEVPYCLGRWKYILSIDLAHNQLAGRIPTYVASSSFLKSLNLRNNSFSGELPSRLRQCASLVLLDVGFNDLSGEIPEWIGESLFELSVLSLRSNKFQGSIPLSLCHLQKLRVLDLSINTLSSTVPSCFSNFTAMIQNEDMFNETIVFEYFLGMERVFLKGREFEYAINWRQVKVIDLASNNLMGQFPEALTNLVQLLALNLSRNEFNGSVPEQIGNLKLLESLDLSWNKFAGELPTTLTGLNFLSYLDLSFNRFSGRIPSGTQLQSFDASRYKGNIGLCGPPLTKGCPRDIPPPSNAGNGDHRHKHNGKLLFWRYFFIFMAIVFLFAIACVLAIIIARRYYLHWRARRLRQ